MDSARELRELQLKIDNISSETLVDTFKWIQNSNVYSQPGGMKLIMATLLIFTYARPKNLNTISVLASFLLKNVPMEEQIDILVSNFKVKYSPFNRVETNNVLFLMNCVDVLKIPYEKIIDQFIDTYENNLFNSDDQFALFMFLGPVFCKYKPALFKSVLMSYHESIPAWVKDFKLVAANNWEIMRQNRKDYGVKGGLTHTIMADDVSQFKMSVMTKSFKITDDLNFSIYEPTIFIGKKPTIFDYALFCGASQIVSFLLPLLLKQDASIKSDSRHIQYAIAGGSLEMVKILEENGFSSDGALQTAVLFHQRELFDYFAEKSSLTGAEKYSTVFHSAVPLANFDILLASLDAGVDPNTADANGRTLVHVAAEYYLSPILQLVLSLPGFDINARDENGSTALTAAVDSNNAGAVAELLKSEAIDVNAADEDGMTPLMHAACYDMAEMVASLLECPRTDPNAVDAEGSTAFHAAFQDNAMDICALLIADPRLDVDVRDGAGLSALHLAAAGTDLNILESALAKTKDVNEKDGDGMTAAHHAAGNSGDFLRAVLEAGADAEAVDEEGRTPLHHAALHGQLDCARLLVERGVKTDGADGAGLRPLQYARKLKGPRGKEMCRIIEGKTK